MEHPIYMLFSRQRLKSNSIPLKLLLGISPLISADVQVHGQVWQWAARCVLLCRSHGITQPRCVILLQGRKEIVVNSNISYQSMDKYFNVVPLFDLLFFLSSSSAEMQAVGSRYNFLWQGWVLIFFHIRLRIFGYSGSMFPKLQQNLRTICSNQFSFESNCFIFFF